MPQAAAGGNTNADTAGVAAAAASGSSAVLPDSNTDFATLVLEDLGIEPSSIDVNNILEWMEHENSPKTWTGTAGANNPLNNGLGSGGGSGLGSYPDLTTSAAEVAGELSGAKGSGLTGGAAVISDLKGNAPEAQFATDIENTNWAGGHYGHSAWSTAPVGNVTAAASAAAGATGPVTVGPGTVTLATGNGSAPGPNDPNGGSAGNAGTDPVLGGSGNILEMLDHWLNPSGGSALTQIATLGGSDIAATAELIVFRGIFVLMFAGIGYLGIKTFLSKSSGSFSPMESIETQQRESRLRQQADTLQAGEERRSALQNAGEGTGKHSVGAGAKAKAGGAVASGGGVAAEAEGVAATAAEVAPEALVLL
jgi:hypothetical protein